MSSVPSQVNRRLFSSRPQASVRVHTQARLYPPASPLQMALSPSSVVGGATRSRTAIHDSGPPNIGVSRDAKISCAGSSWTQDWRMCMPVQMLETSAGQFNSTGTSTTGRAIRAHGGTNHEPCIELCNGDGR